MREVIVVCAAERVELALGVRVVLTQHPAPIGQLPLEARRAGVRALEHSLVSPSAVDSELGPCRFEERKCQLCVSLVADRCKAIEKKQREPWMRSRRIAQRPGTSDQVEL